MAWCFYETNRSLSQCLQSVPNENWTLKNKLQCIFNQHWCIFIQDSTFEKVVCKLVATIVCIGLNVLKLKFEQNLDFNYLVYEI